MINLSKKFYSKRDDELLDSKKFIDLLKLYANKTHINLLFRYEAENYISFDDHLKVCEFMLKHNNPQVKKWNLKYKSTEGSSTLDISNNKRLTNITSLRNLPVDILNVSNTAVWQEWVISDLPLKEVNIVNTKIKNLKEILKMKTLQKLIVSQKQWPKLKPPKDSDLVIIKK